MGLRRSDPGPAEASGIRVGDPQPFALTTNHDDGEADIDEGHDASAHGRPADHRSSILLDNGVDSMRFAR